MSEEIGKTEELKTDEAPKGEKPVVENAPDEQKQVQWFFFRL